MREGQCTSNTVWSCLPGGPNAPDRVKSVKYLAEHYSCIRTTAEALSDQVDDHIAGLVAAVASTTDRLTQLTKLQTVLDFVGGLMDTHSSLLADITSFHDDISPLLAFTGFIEDFMTYNIRIGLCGFCWTSSPNDCVGTVDSGEMTALVQKVKTKQVLSPLEETKVQQIKNRIKNATQNQELKYEINRESRTVTISEKNPVRRVKKARSNGTKPGDSYIATTGSQIKSNQVVANETEKVASKHTHAPHKKSHRRLLSNDPVDSSEKCRDMLPEDIAKESNGVYTQCTKNSDFCKSDDNYALVLCQVSCGLCDPNTCTIESGMVGNLELMVTEGTHVNGEAYFKIRDSGEYCVPGDASGPKKGYKKFTCSGGKPVVANEVYCASTVSTEHVTPMETMTAIPVVCMPCLDLLTESTSTTTASTAAADSTSTTTASTAAAKTVKAVSTDLGLVVSKDPIVKEDPDTKGFLQTGLQNHPKLDEHLANDKRITEHAKRPAESDLGDLSELLETSTKARARGRMKVAWHRWHIHHRHHRHHWHHRHHRHHWHHHHHRWHTHFGLIWDALTALIPCDQLIEFNIWDAITGLGGLLNSLDVFGFMDTVGEAIAAVINFLRLNQIGLPDLSLPLDFINIDATAVAACLSATSNAAWCNEEFPPTFNFDFSKVTIGDDFLDFNWPVINWETNLIQSFTSQVPDVSCITSSSG